MSYYKNFYFNYKPVQSVVQYKKAAIKRKCYKWNVMFVRTAAVLTALPICTRKEFSARATAALSPLLPAPPCTFGKNPASAAKKAAAPCFSAAATCTVFFARTTKSAA